MIIIFCLHPQPSQYFFKKIRKCAFHMQKGSGEGVLLLCGYKKPKNIFAKPLDKLDCLVYNNHVIDLFAYMTFQVR